VSLYYLENLELPQYSDATDKNRVQFLSELAAIFVLERSLRIINLHIALMAMTDSYSRQWFIAMRMDLGCYSDFKEAVKMLLRSTQIQLQICYQAYPDIS
jgi:hypothetical protein